MKKKKWSDVVLVLIFLAGLSLLLYPSFANYWNSLHATQAIANYTDAVAKMNALDISEMHRSAEEYNALLWSQGNSTKVSDELRARYPKELDVTGTGIMGYIQIETLDVSLPVYHGTSEGVMQVAVGHLDWTSLPVGGESTHCVLSGHRGLPSAKLFTDLNRLVEGDVFTLTVLDQVLTYEVDQIRIVRPQEIDSIQIEDGKDYCTLVTCTPYGINTHRLLVRGHRIPNAANAASMRITANATQVEELIVSAILAVPILLGIILYLFLTRHRRRED